MARLTLDTGVLISFYRDRVRPSRNDDVALAALVLAEFRRGVLLDPDARRAAAQQRFLDGFVPTVAVLDYTADVAEHHAELLAYTSREGRPRGQHDLIIAATARAVGRTLVTTDKQARFDGLPGVDVRVV